MLASLETWSDWSESYYVKEDHGEEEETAGDAVNNQSRGGVGEDMVLRTHLATSWGSSIKIPQSLFSPLNSLLLHLHKKSSNI